jgi:regulatory protein
MNDSESFQRASAAAQRFLAYRPRSKAEVRTRLRRRFPSDVVEQVIDDLVDQNLINDSDFAELWKNSRESFRPRSASAVRRELIAKGVDRNIAESAVKDIDDHESAYRAGSKIIRRLDTSDFNSFRRKLWGHLQRRGFSGSVARHATERLWNELDGENQESDE